MLHLHTQQGMTLSEEPPAAVSSPRVSWLQSPSLDVGFRLSADARADESRASPAPLAMGNHAAPLAPPACLRSCVGGGASHPPSIARSTSPPQPSGLFGNGRQRGVQPPAFRTRSPPSLQPLYSEPNADLAARTSARGGPVSMAAARTASASMEAPAAEDDAAGLLSSPGGAEHATMETEAFEEYGSFMPAATSPRLASPCADKQEDDDVVPHAPLPTPHDKRTQTTPRLGLTTSCGTQTSPQPAARGA